jgi:hypothetical protein
MRTKVRDAHPADTEWMSNNTEGWTVTVEKQEGATSLAEALHALIAEDPDQGVRMGWLHSSQQAASPATSGSMSSTFLPSSDKGEWHELWSMSCLFGCPIKRSSCLRETETCTECGLSSDSHTSLGPTKCQGIAVTPVTWCAHR